MLLLLQLYYRIARKHVLFAVFYRPPNSDSTFFLQLKVRKRAKIRNRYDQVPHLTQDTNGKVTTSQLEITNESQEVSPFPAGDHKALTNRRARKHNKTRQK